MPQQAHLGRRGLNPLPDAFPTILAWRGEVPGALHLLDQSALPLRECYRVCQDLEALVAALRALVVRGAPAIGVAAAYGAVLAAQEGLDLAPEAFHSRLRARLALLADARPTAVNLALSVNDALSRISGLRGAGPAAVAAALLQDARRLHAAEEAASIALAQAGARLLPSPARILTHCNTGRLAAPGLGTALGVVYRAAAEGKQVEVFACETRPLWQGLRLTAWELGRAGIPVTVLCDGAAGALLARGGIDTVLVGADRIAANGDVANKIGTYSLAVLAERHGVPFYVAAPLTTFDFSLANGQGIPIETRDASEILAPRGLAVGPPGAAAWNPAFDVTPAELVRGIITEAGVFYPPLARAIAELAGRPGR